MPCFLSPYLRRLLQDDGRRRRFVARHHRHGFGEHRRFDGRRPYIGHRHGAGGYRSRHPCRLRPPWLSRSSAMPQPLRRTPTPRSSMLTLSCRACRPRHPQHPRLRCAPALAAASWPWACRFPARRQATADAVPPTLGTRPRWGLRTAPRLAPASSATPTTRTSIEGASLATGEACRARWRVVLVMLRLLDVR